MKLMGYEANGTALGVEPRWCCLRLKLYLRAMNIVAEVKNGLFPDLAKQTQSEPGLFNATKATPKSVLYINVALN